MSWAGLSSVLSLGVGGGGVEIKAISAQPTEVGVGLSWAELGNKVTDKQANKQTNGVISSLLELLVAAKNNAHQIFILYFQKFSF